MNNNQDMFTSGNPVFAPASPAWSEFLNEEFLIDNEPQLGNEAPFPPSPSNPEGGMRPEISSGQPEITPFPSQELIITSNDEEVEFYRTLFDGEFDYVQPQLGNDEFSQPPPANTEGEQGPITNSVQAEVEWTQSAADFIMFNDDEDEIHFDSQRQSDEEDDEFFSFDQRSFDDEYDEIPVDDQPQSDDGPSSPLQPTDPQDVESLATDVTKPESISAPSSPIDTELDYDMDEYIFNGMVPEPDVKDLQWTIESILDKRATVLKGKRKVEYLVSWAGEWPEDVKTQWVKAINVDPDEVAIYETSVLKMASTAALSKEIKDLVACAFQDLKAAAAGWDVEEEEEEEEEVEEASTSKDDESVKDEGETSDSDSDSDDSDDSGADSDDASEYSLSDDEMDESA